MSMVDMNISERYAEICRLSGLSDEMVRRVLKACRDSMVKSLKAGYTATVPGICTLIPEERTTFSISTGEEIYYIKVKAKPSSALTSELKDTERFEEKRENTDTENSGSKLNYVDDSGIRLKQIEALL